MKEKLDPSVVLAYLDASSSQDHRFKSWDNCFRAFSEPHPLGIHALHLGFYLASWGMYRGSSGLLQKNHLVHIGAVEILLDEKYQKLRCGSEQEVSRERIEDILDLKNALGKHYGDKEFTKSKNSTQNITPTDTLISKVMLGTLGCVPAYDRFFIDGLNSKGLKQSRFEGPSLSTIFEFIENNEVEISDCQKQIYETAKMYYPVMKIVDMYFWQTGYCLPPKQKTGK